MKNTKRLCVLGGILLSLTSINVNAQTNYTLNKKITIGEIENNFTYPTVIADGEKIYMFEDDEKLYEINKNGDKYTLKASENSLEKLIPKFKDVEINFYDELKDDKISYEKSTIDSEETTSIEVTLEGLSGIKNDELTFETVHNDRFIIGQIYASEDDYVEDAMLVYDKKGKLIKKISKENLLKKVNEEESNYQTYLDYYYYSNNTELYIVLNLNSKKYLFNLNEELIFTIEDKDLNSETLLEVIYNNKEEKIIYESCKGEFSDCTLKMVDKKGNITELYKSDQSVVFDMSNGFLTINELDENYENKKTTIYNQDLEVLYSVDKAHVEILTTLSNVEEFKAYINSNTVPGYMNDNVYKEVTNGKYLLKIYTQRAGDEESVKEYLLTVEESKKVDVTGYIKDKDGNPMKGLTVELHSTPRTVTTDENGYFKFEKVEEGDHTLIIKDKDGKVLATKEIKVIEGTETKIEGDTLYFNLKDKGINLNLKLDGEEIKVDSIDKGVKEPENKKEPEKTPDVPKTLDSITTSIIMLITLVLTTLIVLKKSNKIKYLKS